MTYESPFELDFGFSAAINRVDFFRLFKRFSEHHHCPLFFLSEVSSSDKELNVRAADSLHNIPKQLLEAGMTKPRGALGPILAQFKKYVAPFSMEIEQIPSDLVGLERPATAIVIPLHTPIVKRYCLTMLRDTMAPDHEQLASAALDAALIFQRYFEIILSLDSISALSDREIEILRWTSEGKTSGEIATILGLSEHTINSYIAVILRKLQVVNRAQMVACALRNGLID